MMRKHTIVLTNALRERERGKHTYLIIEIYLGIQSTSDKKLPLSF